MYGSDMADTSPTSNSSQQKSPLDVLEEILNESKQGGEGTPAVPSGPTPEELAAQQQAAEQAALLAQAQTQMEQAKARDEQELKAQLTELQQAYQSPQYHEAVRQKTEKQQSDDQQKSDSAGYDIKQLEHKKI